MLKDFIRNALAHSANGYYSEVMQLISPALASGYIAILAGSPNCVVQYDTDNIYFTYDLMQFEAGYLRMTVERGDIDNPEQSRVPSIEEVLCAMYGIYGFLSGLFTLSAINGDPKALEASVALEDEFKDLLRILYGCGNDMPGNMPDMYVSLGHPEVLPVVFSVNVDREQDQITPSGDTETMFPTWISLVPFLMAEDDTYSYSLSAAMGRGNSVIPFKKVLSPEDLKAKLYAVSVQL